MSERHGGHRERLRARFIQNGFAGFAPHEVLELLLFSAIPRKNTNGIAHSLIDRFGSFDRVLEAPYEELIQIDGVGENSALLLRAVFEGFKYYNAERRAKRLTIASPGDALEYASSLFFGETAEVSYLLCFDIKLRLCNTALVSRGNVNAAAVSIRNIVEIAARNRAASVMLAHNHPGGVATPSASDIITTKRAIRALYEIGVSLIDHIIVADDGARSLSDSGVIASLRSELGIR